MDFSNDVMKSTVWKRRPNKHSLERVSKARTALYKGDALPTVGPGEPWSQGRGLPNEAGDLPLDLGSSSL